MLLELAIGDAYGAGFEYAPRKFIDDKNRLTEYTQHPRHKIAPGYYTDDTQMTLAVVEAMLSEEAWSVELLAKHFVSAFKRDPREGYASRFYDFLLQIQDGQDFLRQIKPVSDKSGAAMRACPIGLYPNIEDVVYKSQLQARITHDTPDGVKAAVAASLSTHYFRYQLGPKRELAEFLTTHVPGPWIKQWRGKVGAKGMMSVHAAVSAVMSATSMSHLLRTCVNYGGDVDTVATIALASASFCQEIEQDLPRSLYLGLERGDFGYNYLLTLEQQLIAKGFI